MFAKLIHLLPKSEANNDIKSVRADQKESNGEAYKTGPPRERASAAS